MRTVLTAGDFKRPPGFFVAIHFDVFIFLLCFFLIPAFPFLFFLSFRSFENQILCGCSPSTDLVKLFQLKLVLNEDLKKRQFHKSG